MYEWDEEEINDLPPEGESLWTLTWTEVTRSKSSGLEMVKMTFSQGDHTLYDQVMMEGKGRGIALKKLQEIGSAYRHPEEEKRWVVDDPEQWRGKNVWITVAHEEYEESKGRKRTLAKPDFTAPGFGYRAAGADDEMPPTEDVDDDVPF